jgi:hypothetical protein
MLLTLIDPARAVAIRAQVKYTLRVLGVLSKKDTRIGVLEYGVLGVDYYR